LLTPEGRLTPPALVIPLARLTLAPRLIPPVLLLTTEAGPTPDGRRAALPKDSGSGRNVARA
jgi:hypothetical protein